MDHRDGTFEHPDEYSRYFLCIFQDSQCSQWQDSETQQNELQSQSTEFPQDDTIRCPSVAPPTYNLPPPAAQFTAPVPVPISVPATPAPAPTSTKKKFTPQRAVNLLEYFRNHPNDASKFIGSDGFNPRAEVSSHNLTILRNTALFVVAQAQKNDEPWLKVAIETPFPELSTWWPSTFGPNLSGPNQDERARTILGVQATQSPVPIPAAAGPSSTSARYFPCPPGASSHPRSHTRDMASTSIPSILSSTAGWNLLLGLAHRLANSSIDYRQRYSIKFQELMVRDSDQIIQELKLKVRMSKLWVRQSGPRVQESELGMRQAELRVRQSKVGVGELELDKEWMKFASIVLTILMDPGMDAALVNEFHQSSSMDFSEL